MALTGDENHEISLNDATRFTNNYRNSASTGDFLGGFVGKSTITGILEQESCVGIRIYNAIDDDGKRTYVIVGVKSDEADITGGIIAEYIRGCPPFCPLDSPLAGTD